MNARVLNLGLLVWWLVVLIGLMTRESWMPPALLKRMTDEQMQLVFPVVVAFLIWNALRFWLAVRTDRPPDPTARSAMRERIRRKFGEEPRVTDPQFNFDDPSRPGP
jgi:hypothetical protein